MSTTQTSRLSVRNDPKGGKRLIITYRTKKGKNLEWSPGPGTLSEELAAVDPDALDGREVDFELIAGHPDHIRPKGEPWTAPALSREQNAGGGRGGRAGQRGTAGQGRGARPGREPYRRRSQGPIRRGITQAPRSRDFHNPYNFIPAPRRARIEGPLGDQRPASHQAYLPAHWSGRLGIELTTVTPLLVPDAARATTEDGHKRFAIRRGPDGAPLLAPTSVKGMLRTAYEAITNSRFGIFERHDAPLGLRMEAREGLSMVPAVVTRSGDKIEVQLMPGDSRIGDDGRPEDALMYAAWLPRYRPCRPNDKVGRDKGEKHKALRYTDGGLPQHGDRVWVRVQRESHGSGRFSFLRVHEIQKAAAGGNPPAGWRGGLVCITGRNIMNKHDERVFLDARDPAAVPPIPLYRV